MKDGKAEKKRAIGAVQSTLLSFLPQKEPRKPKIFCDLDGVLVDFERGVVELTGKKPGKSNTRMWPAISKISNFYRHLAWTSDGHELWEAIRPLQPDILTGVSQGSGVSHDKFEWCKRELCVEVRWRDMAAGQRKHARVPHAGHSARRNEAADDNAVCTVITCWSANKHCECLPGDILIDDRPEKLQDAWERKKGIFVHHTSTAETLRILRDLKILPDPEPLQEGDTNTVDTADTPSKEESTEEESTTVTDSSKASFDRESEVSEEMVQTDSTSAANASGNLTDPFANS
jgi:hypothetical protein